MATGWPMKTTYANGDVYSASDVNDITGTINLLTSSTLSIAGGKNFLINGGQDFWQRGTSFALSGGIAAYCADRWQGYSTNLGRTVTRQGSATTGYITRVARDSGNSLTGLIYYGTSLESQTTTSLIGKAVTMSFSARAGANFSSASGILSAYIVYGTGTDQNLFAGLTGQTTVVTSNVTLTTSMQRFTLTGTVNAAATQMAVYFVYTPVGTAGAADYFEVQNIQLELGSTATTFSRAGGTIQGELAACQRYYEKSYAQADAVGSANYSGNGSISFQSVTVNASTAGSLYGAANMPFKVTKRTTPTIVAYDFGGTANAVRVYGSGVDAVRTGVTAFVSARDSGAFNSISVNNTSAQQVPAGSSISFSWTADAEL